MDQVERLMLVASGDEMGAQMSTQMQACSFQESDTCKQQQSCGLRIFAAVAGMDG